MSDTENRSATTNRSSTPSSTAFQQHISTGWAEREDALPSPAAASGFTAERRARLSALYPGQRLVIPAGGMKVRSNDTDYHFRAESDFAYLTGWGSDSEPDSVLVLEPTAAGHEATLYFRKPAGRDTTEFYADASIGEFWIGPRPGLKAIESLLGLRTRDLSELSGESARTGGDVSRDLAELRLIKDAYEIAELRGAVAATKLGFDDIVRSLPRYTGHPRGERGVEGVFDARARLEGNGVGYSSIAGDGHHGCILHWTRNDGPVNDGDLLLVDAGVEADSLYTADITRTLPVNGAFTDTQRMVYDAVLEAHQAAYAVANLGTTYAEMHAAAMRVIAEKTAEWGLLPVSAEESLKPENQFHRRYMIHGTGHMLGLDVHDGAAARRSAYQEAPLAEGMVFTIEPGLYFQADDLTVPEELRGIGIRIEDDILMTAAGPENLSADIPSTSYAVEEWMSSLHP